MARVRFGKGNGKSKVQKGKWQEEGSEREMARVRFRKGNGKSKVQSAKG